MSGPLPSAGADRHPTSKGAHPGVADGQRSTLAAFAERLLVVILFAAVALALWKLTDVLVLLFGAILLAIGLCAATARVSQATGIGRRFALSGVVLVGLCLFGFCFWIFGSTVASQLADVSQASLAGFELFMTWMNSQAYGRQVLEQMHGANVAGAATWATATITRGAGLITRGLAYAFIALFVAIYMAAQPARYRQICLRLVPPARRPVTENLFNVVGQILQRWLVGQLVVMATIGILTGLGLWMLGMPSAFALGLMGGLLCFIPFFGAILASVPATLVALAQSPVEAAMVLCLYVGVHVVEGNFITPMVQAEATSLPPVLAILSTVAFSALIGPLGAFLAVPITLFLMVSVEILYVQTSLGKTVDYETPIFDAPEREYGQ